MKILVTGGAGFKSEARKAGNSMKVLVTGGAGFIGSHLVDRLLENNHQVLVLDDFSGGSTFNIKKGVTWKNVDLRDHIKTAKIISTFKPEIVFHLAANAAENKAQFSPIDITSRNWNTFINTLVPFINSKGKRFVFVSSIAAYGALQTPFKESDTPEPEDLYGVTKLSCEKSLKIMSQVHGFEYVIARPHNVYGPRQNMRDPYRNVVTIWMNAILRKKPWYIYGDGKQKRCFSYIDDVVESLYACGFKNVAGKTFNIGSDKIFTVKQLSVALKSTYNSTKGRISSSALDEVASSAYAPKSLPQRPAEVKEAIADHTLCKRILGYNETPLEEGLKKTWEWVKSVGAVEPIYDLLEIDSPKVPRNWRKTTL